VPAFAEAFVAYANQALTAADLRPKLAVDAEATLGGLDLETVATIRALGPFGPGKPRTTAGHGLAGLGQRAALRWASRVSTCRPLLRRTARCCGASRSARRRFAESLKGHRRCRVVFEPIINEYNGSQVRRDAGCGLQVPE